MTPRAKISALGRMAISIEAQQVNHPEYMKDELKAIVNGQLKVLAEESMRYWAQIGEQV